MMRTLIRFGTLAAAALSLAVVVLEVRADEKEIPIDKVPTAVMKAVKDKFPGAKLVGASKEKEDDKLVYEVTIKSKGHNID